METKDKPRISVFRGLLVLKGEDYDVEREPHKEEGMVED